MIQSQDEGSVAGSEQLAFRPTESLYAAYDTARQPVAVSVQAHLQGMFVLSREPIEADCQDQEQNSNSSSSNNDISSQTEQVLTCYRRNRFQVTGDILLSSWPSSISAKGANESLETDEIEDVLTAQLSAVETRDWTQVVILAGNSRDAAESASAGGPAELEWTAAQCQQQRRHSGHASERAFALEAPLAWDRLQFRSATANNGRKRREIRQRFRVDVSIFAIRKRDGAKVCVATTSSSLLTVRGRSPKNFESRDDQPLTTMTDGRSPTLLRQRHLQLQHQHQHQQHQQENGGEDDGGQIASAGGEDQPTGPRAHHNHQDRRTERNIQTESHPPALFFPEAILPPPVTASYSNSHENQLVYSPTMWDWIDINATTMTGSLDNYVHSMSGAGEAQMFNIPTVWTPTATDNSLSATTTAYETLGGFAFAPELLLQDPMPQAPPSLSQPRQAITPAEFPAPSQSDMTSSSALASASPSVAEAHAPSAAARLPSTDDSGFTPARTAADDRESTSPSYQTIPKKQCKYTYIPTGLEGWQPPVEPVYWAHPWLHMQSKKSLPLVYPPQLSNKPAQKHYFPASESIL